ncbi:pyrroloquinoline quinone biosynthesis peptide chaperone PqqD [Aidingimonas halophila]|uniref:PqqA binding protein n=1 Tax=Aidingimonas halophila TaxID=574349 RepID=A0A1H2Z993_9GAMM|nr:pyrroloquinoline quinone biosynthesis peptide chaperone PqqD [Aidingimonas halophila]GHC15504.1 coenzyme PQQ synthesis protein D [Aidingimonas halophila]SDX13424.1 pyrroloquinoline quinone biosynthesis protein D [Aidingimonas halophila]
MKDDRIYRLRPGWRLQWEEAQGRHVLLYPEGMVKLNDSAGAILSLIDGERNVGDVITELRSRYPQAPADELQTDVHEFLDEAVQQGWIHHE